MHSQKSRASSTAPWLGSLMTAFLSLGCKVSPPNYNPLLGRALGNRKILYCLSIAHGSGYVVPGKGSFSFTFSSSSDLQMPAQMHRGTAWGFSEQVGIEEEFLPWFHFWHWDENTVTKRNVREGLCAACCSRSPSLTVEAKQEPEIAGPRASSQEWRERVRICSLACFSSAEFLHSAQVQNLGWGNGWPTLGWVQDTNKLN